MLGVQAYKERTSSARKTILSFISTSTPQRELLKPHSHFTNPNPSLEHSKPRNQLEFNQERCEMEEDRLEVQRERHRTLQLLNGPEAPPNSTILRKQVGAEIRRAVSTNSLHRAQQLIRPPATVVSLSSLVAASVGPARMDSTMLAPAPPPTHRLRSNSRRREIPASVRSERAPIPIQTSRADDGSMLLAELQSDYFPREHSPVEIPPCNRDSVLPTEDGSLALRVNASRVAHNNRIIARQDRGHSLPAEPLISHTGEITIYEPQPLREYADPPMDITARHTFQNHTPGSMGTSHLRNLRDSMAVTTLHRTDDVVPEGVRNHVSTPYRAPLDQVVHALRVVAKAVGRFRRRKAAREPPASLD
jgi:hypothetical protein